MKDDDEHRRMEAAMAQIAGQKKAVEADPARAIRASLDAAAEEAKRRARRMGIVAALLAGAAAAVYFVLRGTL